MESFTWSTNAETKKLFLKKNIVVKFIPLQNRSGGKRSDTETTTSGTLPTTSIIYTKQY